MKRKTEKSAAIITIKSPGSMTKKGRSEIAAWLRQHAANLVRHGDKYTDGRFTGRYIYE